MRLSGKYEVPENCSLAYYANLYGDKKEMTKLPGLLSPW